MPLAMVWNVCVFQTWEVMSPGTSSINLFLIGTERFLIGTGRFLIGTVRFLIGTVRVLIGTARFLPAFLFQIAFRLPQALRRDCLLFPYADS